jgi:cobalt-zinc-cadmium efflux system membrane fusion protein
MKKLLLTLLVVAAGATAAVSLGLSRFASSPLERKPDTAAPAQFSHRVLRYPPGAPQLAYLRIQAVAAQPVPLLEPLHGRIAYDDNVTARVSSPIAGRVTRIAAQAGDRVMAGQPLLWLDSPDYAAAVADLRKAEADARQKRLAYERAKALYEGEVLARKDFEAAENDRRQSEAEAERARARLHNLDPAGQGENGYALRAPVSGIVMERQANPGTEVRPDAPSPLFVVSDPRRLWVIAELPEKDLAKVQVGQTVSVEVDAYPQERFLAKVLAIGDVLDLATRRVVVRCAVDNAGRRLKPEMYARVTPLAEGPQLPRLPNTALVTEGLHTFVFVETEPGVLEKRRVGLAFRGRDASFIAEGLKAGERVVTAGALLLAAELAGN